LIDYEILLMLDTELPEGRAGEIVDRIRQAVEKGGGKWDTEDVWGRRKLAYEINKKTDGDYRLLTLACDPATLDEISRVLKITDGVMRHLAVRRGATTGKPPAPAHEPVAAGTKEEE
jgi:small subunit ribosomal protein S6